MSHLTPEGSLLVAGLILATVTYGIVALVADINRHLDERARRRRMWQARPKRGSR